MSEPQHAEPRRPAKDTRKHTPPPDPAVAAKQLLQAQQVERWDVLDGAGKYLRTVTCHGAQREHQVAPGEVMVPAQPRQLLTRNELEERSRRRQQPQPQQLFLADLAESLYQAMRAGRMQPLEPWYSQVATARGDKPGKPRQ